MLDPIRKDEGDMQGYLLRMVDQLNFQISTLEAGIMDLSDRIAACESRIEEAGNEQSN